MSLLYKPKEEQTISIDVLDYRKGKIYLEFSSDCGKFGTDESLAGFVLTPKRLLQILSERDDIADDEI